MQVFHTAGVPPSSGSSSRPTYGSRLNIRKALKNKVVPKERTRARSATADGSRTHHLSAWTGPKSSRQRCLTRGRGVNDGTGGRSSPSGLRGVISRLDAVVSHMDAAVSHQDVAKC